jgi:steroid 5-alpha reductase family enzyme
MGITPSISMGLLLLTIILNGVKHDMLRNMILTLLLSLWRMKLFQLWSA